MGEIMAYRVMAYRVMAQQETGEEMCVQNGIPGEFQAIQIASDFAESHEEMRGVWIEPEHDYPMGPND